VFDAGDAGVGFLLAARGMGALVGPWIGRRLIAERGQRLVGTLGVAIVCFGLSYMLLPAAPTLGVAITVVFVAHCFGGHQWVASTEGLQRTTPDGVRGRVMAMDFALATLSMGTSALLGSALAEVVGLQVATRILAGMALSYGVFWLWWTRRLWSADIDPLTVRAPGGADADLQPTG